MSPDALVKMQSGFDCTAGIEPMTIMCPCMDNIGSSYISWLKFSFQALVTSSGLDGGFRKELCPDVQYETRTVLV